MAFNHKYNTDDVFIRAVIVGLIQLLNSKIQIVTRISDTESKTIPVLFRPSMTGQERFLQDFFLDYTDCDGIQFVEGNFDSIPNGKITFNGGTIASESLTNKYVRGVYEKEENGELRSYSSRIHWVPINMDFECKVTASSHLESFKLWQLIISTFYKAKTFDTSYLGIRIPCQAGFPEDITIEKQVEFSFGDTKEYPSLTFTIAAECYFPIIDNISERFRGNIMNAGITPNISVGDVDNVKPIFAFGDTKDEPNISTIINSNQVYDGGGEGETFNDDTAPLGGTIAPEFE